MKDVRKAELSRDGCTIYVTFSITDQQKWLFVKESVKSLPGRKFNSEHKRWEVPLSESSLKKLASLGFDLCPKLKNVLDRISFNPADAVEIEVPGFGKDLYPFQKKGVWFLEKKDGRALIADEMGLGKTLQALGWLHLHPEMRPVVVVCPASVKLKWQRETEECMHRSAQVLSGTSPKEIESDIVIINYDILKNWLDILLRLDPKVVVLDECHYIKNGSTARARAVKILTQGRRVIGLSGTPVMNNPQESFNIIRTIDHYIFPSFSTFKNSQSSKSLLKLHKKLVGSIMMRRRKQDVLSELPDKRRDAVPIETVNIEEYFQLEEEMGDIIHDLLEEYEDYWSIPLKKRGHILAKLNEMRKKSGEIKLPGVIEWIEDFLKCDGKLAVFAHHRNVVEEIHRSFPDSVVVYGGMNESKKEKAVQAFQHDPNVRLFVGNIKAAGVGIDLTASSNVAFAELPWTPADLIQAEDRCHRIGQKSSVNVFYLIAPETIDGRMMEILDRKQRIVDAVLDGKAYEKNVTIINEIAKYYWDRECASAS